MRLFFSNMKSWVLKVSLASLEGLGRRNQQNDRYCAERCVAKVTATVSFKLWLHDVRRLGGQGSACEEDFGSLLHRFACFVCREVISSHSTVQYLHFSPSFQDLGSRFQTTIKSTYVVMFDPYSSGFQFWFGFDYKNVLDQSSASWSCSCFSKKYGRDGNHVSSEASLKGPPYQCHYNMVDFHTRPSYIISTWYFGQASLPQRNSTTPAFLPQVSWHNFPAPGDCFTWQNETGR